ncbi:MAG: response regulator transcription factor [Cytophagales bacterium]|nr:response regulator transcription factor [Cytophagales bacterium]
MHKILVVEDESAMQIGLKDNLEFEGYSVDTAMEGETGLDKLLENQYDLVLLDVMLPHKSGFDICKEARAKGVDTPIIFLTAKGEEIDKVLGLELGADDYITKPFSVRELLARVKALLRRSHVPAAASLNKVTIGRLALDFNSYIALENDLEVKLSHKEFEVLHYLFNHRNQAVSRHSLLEDIWGYDEQPTTRTVDNFIVRLRQKIEENPNSPRVILTVHGYGYKMLH